MTLQKPSRIETFTRIGIAVILITVAILISFIIRTGPMTMDALDEQVERSIHQNIRTQIAEQIRAQNPGLPDAFINDQIESEYRAYLAQPGIADQIREAARMQADSQRDYFTNPDTGRMYLSDLDPYYFLYYTQNILQTGMIGDSERDGVQWDDRMIAPVGKPVEALQLHPYLLAGTYLLLSSFDDDMDVTLAASWYPPIIFSIIVILVFLMAAAITNVWGGLFSALTVSMLPGTLGRTMFGRADSDVLVVLFPTLIIFLFLEAFTQRQLWAKLTLASIAGIFVGVFSWTWSGWWYPVVFILTTIAVYLAYRFIEYWVRERVWERSERLIRIALITGAIVTLGSYIAISALARLPALFEFGLALGAGSATVLGISLLVSVLSRGSENPFAERNAAFWNQPGVWQPLAFTGAFTFIAALSVLLFRKSFAVLLGPLGVLTFSDIRAPTRDIFPNVYTTVAELNPGETLINVYRSVVGGVSYPLGTLHGTIGIFATVLIAGLLIYAGVRLLREAKKERDPVAIVITILAGTLFAFIALAALFGATNAAGQNVRAVSVGFLLVGLAVVGIAGSLVGRRNEDGSFDVRYGILIAVWVIATTYATLLGIRFALLLAPAFAIAVGIGIGYLISIVVRAFKDEGSLALRFAPAASMIILLLALVFFMPGTIGSPSGEAQFGWRGLYGQAAEQTRLDLPLVDDTWYELYTTIANETSEDTILTSWWDFGHHYKYYTRRAVTFDGASQNSATAHWVGNLLITRSEKQSIGTLRMLACSNHYGFTEIDESIVNESFATLDLVKTITGMTSEEADEWLISEGYSAEERTFILERTHCEPRPNLVIASGDMVGKAGVWGHFGSWSFERAAIYNEISRGMSPEAARALLRERLNLSVAEAIDVYAQISADQRIAQQWISPYPSYFGQVSCQFEGNDTLVCPVQFEQRIIVRINTSEQRAYVDLGSGPVAVPFAMMGADGFSISDVENPPINVGFALVGSNQLIISSVEHVGSVFQRLYYYDGAGLECYEPFLLQDWPRGGKINTYEADWSCAEQLN